MSVTFGGHVCWPHWGHNNHLTEDRKRWSAFDLPIQTLSLRFLGLARPLSAAPFARAGGTAALHSMAPKKKKEESYEVEKIVDMKLEKGKKMYLVKWKEPTVIWSALCRDCAGRYARGRRPPRVRKHGGEIIGIDLCGDIVLGPYARNMWAPPQNVF